MTTERVWQKCTAVRPVDSTVYEGFSDAPAAFYRRGHWLPPPMLLDFWLVSTGDSWEWRNDRWRKYPEPPEAYRSWLRSWSGVARAVVQRRSAPVWMAPALVVAHVLEAAGDAEWVGVPPDELRDFDAWADRCVKKAARTKSPLGHACRRAYEIFKHGEKGEKGEPLRLDQVPSTVYEVRFLEGWLPQTCVVDPTVFLLEQKAADSRTRPVRAKPPEAPAPGREAYRRARWERGTFYSREPGRLPENPARLAPMELLFRRLSPQLFRYRVATNTLLRTFGSWQVRDRRRPVWKVEISVVEDAHWHRRRRSSPYGLVSTVRAALEEILTRYQLAVAEHEWDLVCSVEWHGIVAYWRGSCVWEWSVLESRRGDRRKAMEVAKENFPVAVCPPQHLCAGKALKSGVASDGGVSIEIADGRRAPTVGKEPSWRVRPSNDGEIEVAVQKGGWVLVRDAIGAAVDKLVSVTLGTPAPDGLSRKESGPEEPELE